MGKRTKLWKSISLLSIAGVASLSGCSDETEGEGEAGSAHLEAENPHGEMGEMGEGHSVAAAGEGEGGEGGEGEGSETTAEMATSDIAYLTHLGLIKGHLYVGSELYKAGHVDHAKTHMKHPESELYADLIPAFEARNVEGFAAELSAISNAVEQDKGVEAVQAAFDNLMAAIDKSAMATSETSNQPAEQLKLVVQLLRVAADEYAIAVVDGQMKNAHEYQDAFGFTTIAKSIVASIASEDEAVLAAKTSATEVIAELKPHWTALVPPETLSTEAGALYGAAAKIELLALGLE